MKTQSTDLNPTTKRFPRSTKQPVIEHYRRPLNKNYVFAILLIVGTIAGSILMKVI
jgi:hypothetical protein